MSILFNIPDLTPIRTVVTSIRALTLKPILIPNVRYVVIDETLNKERNLINLKLMVMQDTQHDFYVIVEESSEADRWKNENGHETYFKMRINQLEKIRHFFVRSRVLDREFFFIQFTIFLIARGPMKALDLCNKINRQMMAFRKDLASKA